MADTIFEESKAVAADDKLMSFADCPNRCRDGYYVDPYLHRRVRCQHCFERRKQVVQERIKVAGDADYMEVLHLPKTYVGYSSVSIEGVIPSTESKKMTPASYEIVGSVLSELINQVSLGEALGCSLLLNFGKIAYSPNFFYPYLVKSYIGGLTTSPLVTARDLINLRRKEEGTLERYLYADYADLNFKDLLKSDTCLLYADAGSTDASLVALKGVMQLRALNGKSTLIVTDAYGFIQDFITDVNLEEVWTSETARKLVSGELTGSGKELATYVSVHYAERKARKDSEKSGASSTKASYGQSELSQKEFDSLIGR